MSLGILSPGLNIYGKRRFSSLSFSLASPRNVSRHHRNHRANEDFCFAFEKLRFLGFSFPLWKVAFRYFELEICLVLDASSLSTNYRI